MTLPSPPELDLGALARLLSTRKFGRSVEHHARIGSTNDRALEWALSGAPDGALVTAEEQSQGRGRQGRAWHSAPGQGIWASVVVRTSRPAQEQSQVPLIAGLALAEALGLDFGVQGVGLRWPNDLELGGRKLAGFLCERVSAPGGDRIIVGSGINVAAGAVPDWLRDRAVSLEEAGCPLPRERLLAAYLGRFEARLLEWETDGFGGARAAYLSLTDLPGREVRLLLAGGSVQGTVLTVDEAGALVIRSGDEIRAYFAGEVERMH